MKAKQIKTLLSVSLLIGSMSLTGCSVTGSNDQYLKDTEEKIIANLQEDESSDEKTQEITDEEWAIILANEDNTLETAEVETTKEDDGEDITNKGSDKKTAETEKESTEESKLGGATSANTTSSNVTNTTSTNTTSSKSNNSSTSTQSSATSVNNNTAAKTTNTQETTTTTQSQEDIDAATKAALAANAATETGVENLTHAECWAQDAGSLKICAYYTETPSNQTPVVTSVHCTACDAWVDPSHCSDPESEHKADDMQYAEPETIQVPVGYCSKHGYKFFMSGEHAGESADACFYNMTYIG